MNRWYVIPVLVQEILHVILVMQQVQIWFKQIVPLVHHIATLLQQVSLIFIFKPLNLSHFFTATIFNSTMQRGCSFGCTNPNSTNTTSYGTTCCTMNLCNSAITVPSVRSCYSCDTTSTSSSDSCYSGNALGLQSILCPATTTHCSRITSSKTKLHK